MKRNIKVFILCIIMTVLTFLKEDTVYAESTDNMNVELMQSENGGESENKEGLQIGENIDKETEVEKNGFVEIEEQLYFYLDNEMQTGMLQIQGNIYYFMEDGSLYTETGWTFLDNDWYYFDMDHTAHREWLRWNNKWYYMDEDGVMQTGILTIQGNKYYLKSGGAMALGWEWVDDGWYHFSKSGSACLGWELINGAWYYFDHEGVMQTGMQCIGNKKYYLDSNGKMAYGWICLDNNWYYFGVSGAAQQGWIKISEKWYYMDAEGIMQIGWIFVDGEWYYLSDSGAMQTGMQFINGKWYLLSKSGRWLPEMQEKFEEIKTYTYVPYVYGGSSTSGWDCSGFVQYAMKQLGVSLPRCSADQATCGSSVDILDRSSWRPGDLIFYERNGQVGHAALYLGDGLMMHAVNPKKGTYITTVDEYNRIEKVTKLAYVKRVL